VVDWRARLGPRVARRGDRRTRARLTAAPEVWRVGGATAWVRRLRSTRAIGIWLSLVSRTSPIDATTRVPVLWLSTLGSSRRRHPSARATDPSRQPFQNAAASA
jgi:hypothetical protein